MCCSFITSCFGCSNSSRVTDDDEGEIAENAVIVPALYAEVEKIRGLKAQLKVAIETRDQLKAMKDRPHSNYTGAEKALFARLTAVRPFPFMGASSAFAPSAQPATTLRQRAGVPDNVQRAADSLEAQILGQKYSNGVKYGNWESRKASVLGIVVQQLQSQGVKDEALIQVLNAIKSADVRKEFATVVSGLNVT